MRFFNLRAHLHRPFTTYLMALLLLCLAYILGNLPFLFLIDTLDASSVNSTDLLKRLQSEFGKTVALIVLLAPWAFLCLSFIPISKYVLKWPILEFFTTRTRFDLKRFFFGFIAWFAISMTALVVQFNDNFIWQFDWSTFIPLFFVAAIILFLQCTAEELVFRSFLIKWAGQNNIPFLVQILLSGFVFGYLHSANPEVETLGNIALIYYIGTGLFLALIAHLDDGIELTMGFHFANNFFAAIIVTTSWQVFQTDAILLDTTPPSFGLKDVVVSLLTQSVFFLIFWKTYKWKFRTAIKN